MTTPLTPCATVDPETFFKADFREAAKSLCDMCPTKAFNRCRELAEATMDPYAVMAAESGPERIGRLIREAGGAEAPKVLWTRLVAAVGDTTANAAAEQSGLPLDLVADVLGLTISEKTYVKTSHGVTSATANSATDTVSAVRREEQARSVEQVRALEREGWTQAEVSELTGSSLTTVRKYWLGVHGQRNQNSMKAVENRQKVYTLLDDGRTAKEIEAEVGLAERTVYRLRAEWKRDRGIASHRVPVIVAAAIDVEVPPMPIIERHPKTPKKLRADAVDLEAIWRLTHQGKSKAEIAAITGYAYGSIGRARKKLNDAVRALQAA